MELRAITEEVRLWKAGNLTIGELTWPLWILMENGLLDIERPT